MDKFLTGKFAIVTGATRGIGRAIAETLAASGAAVAICSRKQEEAESAAKEIAAGTGAKVVGAAADVSNEKDVQRLFEFVDRELGGLDILVNNAGIGAWAPVAELTIDDWRRVMGTNLDGVFYCCHEALPRFRHRGSGFVINISSLAGKNPMAGGSAYNASKFGLNGFSEAMMMDHRYDNVKVCYIMPGSVSTDFNIRRAGVSDWKIAPEDIAEIVLTVLRMPERTLISRVEVRPSKPKK